MTSSLDGVTVCSSQATTSGNLRFEWLCVLESIVTCLGKESLGRKIAGNCRNAIQGRAPARINGGLSL